jgi:hypothetical protein
LVKIMLKVKFTNGAPKLKAKPLSDYNFNLTKQVRETLISGESQGETTDQDLVYVVYNPSVIKTEEDVFIDDITLNEDIKVFESRDTDIATIDQNGKVTRVADGTARIVVRGKYLAKGINVDVAQTNEPSYEIFDRYADGSLAKDLNDGVDLRIAGTTASESKPIYSTQDHSGQNYVRNTDCWANDLDLTPISPWNSTGNNTRAGTLISPRHIIFAKHYQIATGATVRFIKSDGTVVNRTMTAKQTVSTDGTDITIGVLDSDVPEGISFAKVLPDNWGDYLPNIDQRVPAFFTDQQEKALVADVNFAYDTTSELFRFRYPVDDKRLEYSETLIGGDSGNPAFFIIDDELVILSCWWYGGAGSGPNILKYKSDINSIMTSLGGGYQLTEVGLTSFTDYS